MFDYYVFGANGDAGEHLPAHVKGIWDRPASNCTLGSGKR